MTRSSFPPKRLVGTAIGLVTARICAGCATVPLPSYSVEVRLVRDGYILLRL